MPRSFILILALFLFQACGPAPFEENLAPRGLQDSVEVVRDNWGVNHIYARNERDLFFMQGYLAARDRLFQLEIWRRQATGTVAELLGERALQRDIGTRLFRFRGDLPEEMDHYHPRGREIITAFTDGVNAYIEEINRTPERLPVEFQLLDMQPQPWTPEVVISRHQGLLGNIEQELDIGRAVAAIGPEKVKELMWFHPKEPQLDLDPGITAEMLQQDILRLYKAYRRPVRFLEEDVLPNYRNTPPGMLRLSDHRREPEAGWSDLYIGSNNWVVSGSRTADGHTYMANDPHRSLALPSLRYMVHLSAPGWNVIGGGEPEIPGVSIGHNEHGAWGLTVFRTDGEDLMVYDLNPDNLNQYRFRDRWRDFETETTRIPVKDADSVTVTLRYSRHGPVTHIDSINRKAYAVRCAWLEPGGSPYLASLRMDQARNWQEFRTACNYSHIPGENMVWADKYGHIGWQAVGIAPVRRNFSGLVPVPGDGRYEWAGYLPIRQKPHVYDPPEGFFSTANQNVTPAEYRHWDAIGFNWADPFRGDRVKAFLGADTSLTMTDMQALQMDYLSLPARTLVPRLLQLPLEGAAAAAREELADWDYRLEPNSVAAGIYVAWENALRDLAAERFIPESVRDHLPGIQLHRLIEWIEAPDERFGGNPEAGRNEFLAEAFTRALEQLRDQLGGNIDNWQYGQAAYKHSQFLHPLARTVNTAARQILNTEARPRGGNSYTPNATGSNQRQTHGATFRMIVHTGDWDAAIGTNAPGQSGDPRSPFYDNLYDPWAQDEYFPLFFSREKVDSAAAEKWVFGPFEEER